MQAEAAILRIVGLIADCIVLPLTTPPARQRLESGERNLQYFEKDQIHHAHRSPQAQQVRLVEWHGSNYLGCNLLKLQRREAICFSNSTLQVASATHTLVATRQCRSRRSSIIEAATTARTVAPLNQDSLAEVSAERVTAEVEAAEAAAPVL